MTGPDESARVFDYQPYEVVDDDGSVREYQKRRAFRRAMILTLTPVFLLACCVVAVSAASRAVSDHYKAATTAKHR